MCKTKTGNENSAKRLGHPNNKFFVVVKFVVWYACDSTSNLIVAKVTLFG